MRTDRSKRNIQWVVIHTAADSRNGGANDTTAEDITRWHIQRGYTTIGYHYVVRRNGTIEHGRPESRAGAHARGINHNSIGICLSGHGDLQPMTPAQMKALLDLLTDILSRYRLKPNAIIGHREINALVEQGTLSSQYRTDKTCPGRMIRMQEIRDHLQDA